MRGDKYRKFIAFAEVTNVGYVSFDSLVKDLKIHFMLSARRSQ